MERFSAEPSAFSQQVDAQRKVLESLPRIQVACPVSGDPIDPTLQVSTTSGPVYLCSPDCRDHYAKAPEQYRGGLADSFWHQTTCPVDGNQIDPDVSTTLRAGEKVYLCSVQCRDELKGDPGKYAPQLAKQGVRLRLN